MKQLKDTLLAACVLSAAACSGYGPEGTEGSYGAEGEATSYESDLLARAAAGEELTLEEEYELDEYLPDAEPVEAPELGVNEGGSLQELVREEPVRETEPAQSGEFGQTQQALFGSGACKNVDIKISNRSYATPIKILAVEYWSQTDEKWRTENLANTELPAGYYAWWYNEDLDNSRGNRIGTWKIHYRYYTGNGTWGSVKVTDNERPVNGAYGEICTEGKNYELVWDE